MRACVTDKAKMVALVQRILEGRCTEDQFADLVALLRRNSSCRDHLDLIFDYERPMSAAEIVEKTLVQHPIILGHSPETATANEEWLIYSGDDVVQKKTREGIENLTLFERLIYCVWKADYSLRNAADLNAARDFYENFQREAAQLANDLSLKVTCAAFELPTEDLQRQYFERFDDICNELILRQICIRKRNAMMGGRVE